jgi:hypothetical protein
VTDGSSNSLTSRRVIVYLKVHTQGTLIQMDQPCPRGGMTSQLSLQTVKTGDHHHAWPPRLSTDQLSPEESRQKPLPGRGTQHYRLACRVRETHRHSRLHRGIFRLSSEALGSRQPQQPLQLIARNNHHGRPEIQILLLMVTTSKF